MTSDNIGLWWVASFVLAILALDALRPNWRRSSRLLLAVVMGSLGQAIAVSVSQSWREWAGYILAVAVTATGIVGTWFVMGAAIRVAFREWRAARAQPPQPEEEPLLDLGPVEVAKDIAAAVSEFRTQSGDNRVP